MKYKLLNTSNPIQKSIWIDRQEALIASLNLQPLIIVLRPQDQDFQFNYKNQGLFHKISKLDLKGVRNIEIAWHPHKRWIELVNELRTHFPKVNLGAASVTSSLALDAVIKAKLSYAMTPVWNQSLQEQARELNQVLVPGVFSPSEILKSISFGHRLIKLFPASNLGMNYLKQLQTPLSPLPFIIAAGGIIPKDIKLWLDAGYNAIALGRGLSSDQEIDPLLEYWLQENNQ